LRPITPSHTQDMPLAIQRGSGGQLAKVSPTKGGRRLEMKRYHFKPILLQSNLTLVNLWSIPYSRQNWALGLVCGWRMYE